MRGKKIRTVFVARLPEIGLDEDPIEFELALGTNSSLKLERRNEAFASSLIRVG
jgi:hypothetical protein